MTLTFLESPGLRPGGPFSTEWEPPQLWGQSSPAPSRRRTLQSGRHAWLSVLLSLKATSAENHTWQPPTSCGHSQQPQPVGADLTLPQLLLPAGSGVAPASHKHLFPTLPSATHHGSSQSGSHSGKIFTMNPANAAKQASSFCFRLDSQLLNVYPYRTSPHGAPRDE